MVVIQNVLPDERSPIVEALVTCFLAAVETGAAQRLGTLETINSEHGIELQNINE